MLHELKCLNLECWAVFRCRTDFYAKTLRFRKRRLKASQIPSAVHRAEKICGKESDMLLACSRCTTCQDVRALASYHESATPETITYISRLHQSLPSYFCTLLTGVAWLVKECYYLLHSMRKLRCLLTSQAGRLRKHGCWHDEQYKFATFMFGRGVCKRRSGLLVSTKYLVALANRSSTAPRSIGAGKSKRTKLAHPVFGRP